MSTPRKRRRNKKIREFTQAFEAAKVAAALEDGGWTEYHVFLLSPVGYDTLLRNLHYLEGCAEIQITVRYKGTPIRRG